MTVFTLKDVHDLMFKMLASHRETPVWLGLFGFEEGTLKSIYQPRCAKWLLHLESGEEKREVFRK